MKKSQVLPFIFATLLLTNTGCVSQDTHQTLGEAHYIEHDSEDISHVETKLVDADDGMETKLVDADDGTVMCYENDVPSVGDIWDIHGSARIFSFNNMMFKTIEPSIIEIDTVSFGIVNFIPAYTEIIHEIAFFLEKDGLLVYQFPSAEKAHFFDDDLTGFYYGDLNNDGLDDLVIIAGFYAGTSPSPCNMESMIFIQHEKGFCYSESINSLIRDNTGWLERTEEPNDWHPHMWAMDHRRVSIDEILEYIFSQDIDWDE